MKCCHCFTATVILLLSISTFGAEPQPYKSFKVTVYIPVQVVERMAHDLEWMQSSWKAISSRLHVDKVFIESYRAGVSADDAHNSPREGLGRRRFSING